MYSYTYINEQTYNNFLKQKTKKAKLLCIKSLSNNEYVQKRLSALFEAVSVILTIICMSVCWPWLFRFGEFL